MTQASQFRRDRGPGALVLVFWLPLPALSAGAGWRLARTLDGRVVAGVPALVSLATRLACRRDQRRAETGARRVPEAALHLAGLPGGGLAPAAGRRLRGLPS